MDNMVMGEASRIDKEDFVFLYFLAVYSTSHLGYKFEGVLCGLLWL